MFNRFVGLKRLKVPARNRSLNILLILYFSSIFLFLLAFFLLSEQQVNITVIPSSKRIIRLQVFDIGRKEPFHPLYKLQVVLILSLH